MSNYNEPTQINHETYPKRLRTKTHAELRYILEDARAAIAAQPNGHKAGFYADEISYVSDELYRRDINWRRIE